jgi:hypothetical protein
MVLTQKVVVDEPSSPSFPGTTYNCRRKQGALLTLPQDGLRKDVIRTKVFEDYIRDHVDSWYSFAVRKRLDVERMEDLILVTGCTLVTSWGVAAFIDSAQDAEVLLRFRGNVFDWREIRPSVAYQNSHPVRLQSQIAVSFTNFFFPATLERIIHIRTNACSSEAFEQSASFCGPDLRAQRDPFLMILIIGERMRYKSRESRMFQVYAIFPAMKCWRTEHDVPLLVP